jgi:hypothetical protein
MAVLVGTGHFYLSSPVCLVGDELFMVQFASICVIEAMSRQLLPGDHGRIRLIHKAI